MTCIFGSHIFLGAYLAYFAQTYGTEVVLGPGEEASLFVSVAHAQMALLLSILFAKIDRWCRA